MPNNMEEPKEEKKTIICPYEPLLYVEEGCTEQCSKCLIANNGRLYSKPCGYID